MPLNNPAYPRGPYRFYNREFVVISYRTDPEIMRAVVPEPLEVVGDMVIRVHPHARFAGFGDYPRPPGDPGALHRRQGEVQEGA